MTDTLGRGWMIDVITRAILDCEAAGPISVSAAKVVAGNILDAIYTALRAEQEQVDAIRKLGNISNALWVDAEREIKKLKREIKELKSSIGGEGPEMVCFTRGRFDEMVKEKEALDREIAALRAEQRKITL